MAWPYFLKSDAFCEHFLQNAKNGLVRLELFQFRHEAALLFQYGLPGNVSMELNGYALAYAPDDGARDAHVFALLEYQSAGKILHCTRSAVVKEANAAFGYIHDRVFQVAQGLIARPFDDNQGAMGDGVNQPETLPAIRPGEMDRLFPYDFRPACKPLPEHV
ncbi:MAG: hypothetical protein P8X55_17830 [Desulfosarcinaceae bacterium]